jgi:hypothetical protein
MLGAIAGDVIGSVHEAARTKTKLFALLAPDSRFTDDTVLTVAVADALLHGRDYVDALKTGSTPTPTPATAVRSGPTSSCGCTRGDTPGSSSTAS